MSAVSSAPPTRRGAGSGRSQLRPLARSYVATRGGTNPLRRAVAMLEFALILPIFLLMLVFAFMFRDVQKTNH